MANNSLPSVTIPKNYDVLRFWKDGSLFLGASDLTGRLWTGVVCCFQDADKTDLQFCTAAKEVESGVCDGITLPQEESDCNKAIISYDYGGVEALELVHDETGAAGPVFTNTAYSCEHDDAVISISLTSDKQKFVSGSYDKSIKIWDLETFSACSTYAGAHWNLISNIACHPESSDVFASCSKDGRALMWDTRLPRPASLINRGPFEAAPSAIAWQPNQATRIVIGDETGSVVVTDVRNTNGKLRQIVTNQREIYRMEFSPWCQQQVAIIGNDPTVSVLNVMDDYFEISYVDSQSHSDFVHGLAWHPISHKLYTCSWDKSIVSHSISATENGSS